MECQSGARPFLITIVINRQKTVTRNLFLNELNGRPHIWPWTQWLTQRETNHTNEDSCCTLRGIVYCKNSTRVTMDWPPMNDPTIHMTRRRHERVPRQPRSTGCQQHVLATVVPNEPVQLSCWMLPGKRATDNLRNATLNDTIKRELYQHTFNFLSEVRSIIHAIYFYCVWYECKWLLLFLICTGSDK